MRPCGDPAHRRSASQTAALYTTESRLCEANEKYPVKDKAIDEVIDGECC